MMRNAARMGRPGRVLGVAALLLAAELTLGPQAALCQEVQQERGFITASATLPPFRALKTCVPFNVLVKSSESANGSLALTAEAAVINATEAAFVGDMLIVALRHGFAT